MGGPELIEGHKTHRGITLRLAQGKSGKLFRGLWIGRFLLTDPKLQIIRIYKETPFVDSDAFVD